LSRSLRPAAHRAVPRPPAPGSRPDPMTFLPVPWHHPFAGTSRSRRRVHFISAPSNVGRTSPTSRQSGRRVRQQRSVPHHQRLSALAILRKPSPAKAPATPKPHRRPNHPHRFPAGSFFGGFRTPALYRVDRSRRAGIRNPSRKRPFAGPQWNREADPQETFLATPADRWIGQKAVIGVRLLACRRPAHVNSSSSPFASFRSAVLKPSVNQP